jgi:ABC-type phosphate transport system substrate-binding protein
MKKSLVLSAVILLFFVGIGLPARAAQESPDDILVFVSQSSNLTSITTSELKQIFLKQKTTWQGKGTIVCINSPSASKLRKQFRDQVLGMTEAEESTYWETIRIRNQVFEPAEMLNTPKAVFRLKNAVSYAYRKDVPNGVVKVILVLSK